VPREESLDDLLARISGRRNAGLTIDDIAAVCGDLLKAQRREILAHMHRLLRLEQAKANDPRSEERDKNVQRRLLALESAVRRLERGQR
jgi:hypothetical protein